MSRRVDLAVVGGGITGLAAAWEAVQRGAEVVVLDGAPRLGGKLGTSPLAGMPVEESADAFLARMPDAVELCRELGLADELVSPRTGRAFVWSEGALRPLPTEQLLGVPTDLDAVAASGILSAEGLARARLDLAGADADALAEAGDGRPPMRQGAGSDPDRRAGPSMGHDEAVGALVRRRLGDEVLDRLVAPLIGGIWAGDCDRLSLEIAAPTLAEARRRDASLIRGAAAVRAGSAAGHLPGPGPVSGAPSARPPGADAAGADRPTPVFLAPRGGMTQLVDALARALGDRVRTGQPVERIERLSGGHDVGRWRLEPAGIIADSVVIAAPAFAAAPLVEPHCRLAAQTLAGVDHASMVLVSMAVPRDGIDHPLDGSGFLVPPTEGRLLTTCSWVSSKWEHLAGDGSVALLRASAGRDGDDRALELDDDTLVRRLCDDLHKTMGLQAEPTAVRVNRWLRAFPQPRPGHLARVVALETALTQEAPGLAVAGPWARGLGIPACVRSGRQAAAELLRMRSSGP